LASCRSHRLKPQCKRMLEFTTSLDMRRCNPRMISWPGAQFRRSPATPPPRAGASAAAQPHAGVAGRWIGHQRPRFN
jgi:hypothetical protein